MINAAVLGACGRMGSLIVENITCSKDMQLVAAFDISNFGKDAGEFARVGNLGIQISDVKDLGSVLNKTQAEVLIDFTVASATVVNAPIAARCGVNLIIGTTGLSPEQRIIIDEAIHENQVSAVISPNFSVGVNVFFKIIKEAAKYLADYDVEIIEAHHNQKKDAPSGTALHAADVISEVLRGKEYVYGREGIAPRGKEIGIHAVRAGDITGDHTALFAGNSERIEIRHIAHSPQIFAKGAVRAAEWVCAQKPGIYSMDDVLGL
jgi:4-hydroxy-tetrahydrodipicolinate reductase